MRIITAFLILLGTALSASAQPSISVEVVNLENNKGKVIVALLDEDEKDVKDIHARIKDQSCNVVFRNIPPGKYAVRIIHDENENDKLETNFLGIPREGFGFSNDAMGKFGPKDFSEWLFDVPGDTKIKITATYLF